jgi:hypothetical protein
MCIAAASASSAFGHKRSTVEQVFVTAKVRPFDMETTPVVVA